MKGEWEKTAYRVQYQDHVSSLLSIPEELKKNITNARGSSIKIPFLCFSLRSVVGIMRTHHSFACCIKGFPCLREIVLFMGHFPQKSGGIRSGLDHRDWMQVFYTVLPAESNWQKQSCKTFPVKNFHCCSQSADRLMAL